MPGRLPELNQYNPPDIIGMYGKINEIANSNRRMKLAEVQSIRDAKRFDMEIDKYQQDKEVADLQKIGFHISNLSKFTNQEDADRYIKEVNPPIKSFRIKGTEKTYILSDGSEVSGVNAGDWAGWLSKPENATEFRNNPFPYYKKMQESGVSYKAPKLEKQKLGATRTIQKGTQSVTEEYTSEGWKQVGSGPKFKPDKPDKPNKDSDFETAYKAWSEKDENKDKPREEFKAKVWTPKSETVKLLDLASISVGVDPDKAAKGEITPDEAGKILEKYAEKAGGVMALINLLKGPTSTKQQEELTYDPKKGTFK